MTCEHEVEFAQSLATLKSWVKHSEQRLTRLEELTEVVHELATAMTLMAEEQKRTSETVHTLSDKIDVIESTPVKRWDFILERIITSVVSILVGYILARFGIF